MKAADLDVKYAEFFNHAPSNNPRAELISEKATYKKIEEYIEDKFGFKVYTVYIAEVKRVYGLPIYDASNAVEKLKQPRKHPTEENVEVIKDAFKYFEII